MKFPKLFDVFYMILFMALAKVNLAERISYRDYKLIDVNVNSLQALELLQSLKENPDVGFFNNRSFIDFVALSCVSLTLVLNYSK